MLSYRAHVGRGGVGSRSKHTATALFPPQNSGYLLLMTIQRPSRRQLLAGLAGGAIALPSGARAFSVEPLDAGSAEIYRNACTARNPLFHDDLVKEVVTLLDSEGVATTPDAVRQALSRLSCPYCGCNLAEATDLSDSAPKS